MTRFAKQRAAEPDVLVVGAGSAGAWAAALLAEQGRDVALVDARPAGRAGARWVNGVPAWLFDEAGLGRPQPPERQRAGGSHGAVIADAAGTASVRVPEDPLLHVDMPRLVARLQARAAAAGVRISRERLVGVQRDGPGVRRVILAPVEPSDGGAALASQAVQGFDRGFEYGSRSGDEGVTGPEDDPPLRAEGGGPGARVVTPHLVVDASGFAAAVRRRVPALQDPAGPLAPTDVCVAAQRRFAVADAAGARAFLARHGARPGDSLSFLGVAGGYSVLMVGVDEACEELGLLCGTVPATGAAPGPAVLQRFARDQAWIGTPGPGGGGPIPLGPPCLRLSAPGTALLGDAARMVYAVHGSGVGMGLVAARMLADALGDAPPRALGDPDRLHRYGAAFLRRFGGRLAAADLFRRFSQGLSPSDLTALLASGLMSRETLEVGLRERPFDTGALQPQTLWRGLRRAPGPLFGLAAVGARMLGLQRLYADYPSTGDGQAVARFARQARRIAGRA
jgi:flavin-dependent dehydrogenase